MAKKGTTTERNIGAEILEGLNEFTAALESGEVHEHMRVHKVRKQESATSEPKSAVVAKVMAVMGNLTEAEKDRIEKIASELRDGTTAIEIEELATKILNERSLEKRKGAPQTRRDIKLEDLHPDPLTAEQVRQIRDILNLSQPLFAAFLGVSSNLVKAWEQGVNVPNAMACRLLNEIRRSPGHWLEVLNETRNREAV